MWVICVPVYVFILKEIWALQHHINCTDLMYLHFGTSYLFFNISIGHLTLVVTADRPIHIFLRCLRKKVCCIQCGITLQTLHMKNIWKTKTTEILNPKCKFVEHESLFICVYLHYWCSPTWCKRPLKCLLCVLSAFHRCRLYLYIHFFFFFFTLTCRPM